MGLLSVHPRGAPPARMQGAQRFLQLADAIRAVGSAVRRPPRSSLAGAPMLPGPKRAPPPGIAQMLEALGYGAAAPPVRGLLAGPGRRK